MLDSTQHATLCHDIRQISRTVLDSLRNYSRQHKADGSLVTEVDLQLNQEIRRYLEQQYPQFNYLSEEMPLSEQTAALSEDKPSWCLDPLDGTNNFAAGVPYFAISLALLNNEGAQLGLVYDPFRDEMFHARKHEGAWLNGQKLSPAEKTLPLDEAVALLDFKRIPSTLRQHLLDEWPFGSQRNFGACALEWCWLAAGRGDLYLHGGQKLWDYAAGQLIFTEAGGHSMTLSGETIQNGRLEERSAVASPYAQLFQDWSDWIKSRIKPGP